MDIQEAAKRLDGGQYGKEGSPDLFKEMAAAGLVAVFGASDDLVELRGAVDEELGAYEGLTFHVTPAGLLKNECENDDCPHFAKMEKRAATIEAVWDSGEFAWSFKTEIPHITFDIFEVAEPYCRGIVFALADVPAESSHV